MQHGDNYAPYYSASQYPPSPPAVAANPSSGDFPPSYASAPPYTADFEPPVYSSASTAGHDSCPPPYSQNPEPSSHSRLPHQSEFPSQKPQFHVYSAYNPSPYPPEHSPAAVYPPPQGPPPTSYDPFDPDQQQPVNYAPPEEPIANPNQNSSFSTTYSLYGVPHRSNSTGVYDHQDGYFGDNSVRYGSSGYDHHSSLGYDRDFYDKKTSGMQYDQFGQQDEGMGDGVYAYFGGSSEPYGARGTVPTRSQALFDDYGRSLSFSSGGKDQGASAGKIVKAVPKVDAEPDVKNSVQKFRIKLLSEGGGSSTIDVLCQIGLDGIRILDPTSNRTLRIYPLDTVTRWEVTDPSTFAFWFKSSVDNDPRRIRLQSNSYTTSTILDTVIAATVQLKEMGGKESFVRGRGSSGAGQQAEQLADKKKGFIEWMNFIKPVNEVKEHWVPDEAVSKCTSCGYDFGAFNRRHHCRNCGDIFCDKCTQGRIALTAEENAQPVRVCDPCMAEVTRRLSSAKEAAGQNGGLQSHEDLARKLQEALNKNSKSSSGMKNSNGSDKMTREVACPICTVHLQVQVPASGSATVECGVCQHPFLVNAD